MIAQIIRGWWYNLQLQQALKQDKFQRADYFLKKLDCLGIKLSLSAKLYKQNLQAKNAVSYYKKETANIAKRLQNNPSQSNLLQPNDNFIKYVHQCFKFVEHDSNKLQITGIDRPVFDSLETALADFVEEEINKVNPESRELKLKEAVDDLLMLKKGIDPTYSYYFSPHIYLLKYFTENIYCTYLAWFLVYKSGLLPKDIKILDLAAGPSTSVYGLALLLSSAANFSVLSEGHILYYSLEQQAALQYRGLQFWRRYIEFLGHSTNAYFRFNTCNIFDYQNYNSKLPDRFFNFIVISHCFFYDSQKRQESFQIYSQIFQHNLCPDGYVLLIVQGRKLFNMYDVFPSEEVTEEQAVIEIFLDELGLHLEWYQYLTSTGKRTSVKTGFAKFAQENLPPQNYLKSARQKYLQESYITHYTIDDYVILAKKTDDKLSNI